MQQSLSYVRFAISIADESSQQSMGIFMVMGELRDSGQMFAWEIEVDQRVYAWFNKNLRVPKVQSRGEKTLAISWFKSTATEHIKNMRELVAIIEAHDVAVEQLITTRPGKIVYEDRFQIAVIPFNDTFS